MFFRHVSSSSHSERPMWLRGRLERRFERPRGSGTGPAVMSSACAAPTHSIMSVSASEYDSCPCDFWHAKTVNKRRGLFPCFLWGLPPSQTITPLCSVGQRPPSPHPTALKFYKHCCGCCCCCCCCCCHRTSTVLGGRDSEAAGRPETGWSGEGGGAAAPKKQWKRLECLLTVFVYPDRSNGGER